MKNITEVDEISIYQGIYTDNQSSVCRTVEAWFPGCCFIVQLWVFILVESLPELQQAGLRPGLGGGRRANTDRELL